MNWSHLKSTSQIAHEIDEAMYEISSKWPSRREDPLDMKRCRDEMAAWLEKNASVWKHRIDEIVDWYAK